MSAALRIVHAQTERELDDVNVPFFRDLYQPVPWEEQRRRSRSLAEIWADPEALKPPEQDVVIPRFAWRGYVTIFAAPDKAGKSTLTTAAVASLRQDGEFLGEKCEPASVLWAMLEERINTLAIRAQQFATPPDVRVLEYPREPTRDLRREISEWRPGLVVVDTLIRYAAGRVTEGGSSAQWTPVMAELQGLARDFKVAILVLHHSRRSDGAARDSGEITARADVVIEQKKLHRNEVQQFEVRGRWPMSNFSVRKDGFRYALVGNAPEKLTPMRERVLAALKSGMTFTEWCTASRAKRRTFAEAVQLFIDQGRVQKRENGTYGPAKPRPRVRPDDVTLDEEA